MSGILGPTSSGGGGFLGAKTNISNAVAEPLINNTTALLAGEIVRLNGNQLVTRSQANALANLQGTIGVTATALAATARGLVTTSGRARVLLDAGLTPVAGETAYVSAATAGRGTNVAPANPHTIGIIKDASSYATDSSVIVDVVIDSAPGDGGLESALTENVTNNAGSGLAVGEIVRMSGNDAVTRAQANSAAGVQGTVGVATTAIANGAVGPIASAGKATVLLDAGLTGVTAGRTVFVSAATAGRGTINPPTSFQMPIGTIKDASGYGADSTVVVDLWILPVTGASISSLVADWSLDTFTTRYYAIDYDAGNDNNTGFSDTSMAAAGAVAKKTWEAMLAILPPIGAGRNLVIALKNRAAGAVYRNAANTADADLVLRGYTGYRAIHVVGTTDFSDTTDDIITSGGVQYVAGPNGDGSFTCLAGATTSTFAVAAGLPAEPGSLLKRVRFSPTTATVALRNRCATIRSVTGGITVVVGDTLNAAPAAGDTFFIEHPGVLFSLVEVQRCAPVTLRGIASNANFSSSFRVFGTLGGTNADSDPSLSPFPATLVFCEARGGNNARPTFIGNYGLIMTRTYWDIFANTQTIVGPGFSANRSFQVTGHSFFSAECSGSRCEGGGSTASDRTTLYGVGQGFFGNGCVIRGRIALFNTGWGSGPLPGADPAIGNAYLVGTATPASFQAMRVISTFGGSGGVSVEESNATLLNITWDNSGSLAIQIRGTGCRVRLQSLTGTVPTAGLTMGQTAGQCSECVVEVDTATVTVTGATGDIVASDGTSIIDWADLAITNVIDRNGNRLRGFATAEVVPGICTLVTNVSGVALTVGAVVRSNGTSGQVTRAQADTQANANGALFTMVTSPANNGTGYAYELGRGAWVNFDAAPAAGALAYLDEGTAAVLTTTVPPAAATNQKRRCGWTQEVSGARARVFNGPEIIPTISDGVAP